MITGDRIFGLVVILVALAYVASATQIQVSFLADPVGSKTFPYIIGTIGAICGLYMVIRPDPDPEWPDLPTLGRLGFALLALVAYAYMLKPLGFLIPTAIVAAILSYQISPRPLPAILSGLGLSAGLYVVFKFLLGLSLTGLPKVIMG
ncbi:tripartite tricarboxylate transporter TctB family protein [Defluviimonas sp. WL0024]|uniref:Tripartite tricarboxylate transporter TctB family protein n=2 Tax=Albidovulum TaxID=205889 RepID=A0ABT3J1E3_9RHOB|nr:tripartite tricarboxylate transporter TctB family protein [Defluviimonas sp. WL0024]MCU9848077.1 tripartite tricarboxylate transporter TctB family protein [Defluviimonas sp. WL0024]MCW3781493.1 tripartite tricarboxylate transporter TctB family protein [Defluviimonas salinarum]